MMSQNIRQYFTFNIKKSYTFVDVQVTDEGKRDYEFPECLLNIDFCLRCKMYFYVYPHLVIFNLIWAN